MESGLAHTLSVVAGLALAVFFVTPNKFLGPGLWAVALFLCVLVYLLNFDDALAHWEFWAFTIGGSGCFAFSAYRRLNQANRGGSQPRERDVGQ